jgi:hypothetical protein
MENASLAGNQLARARTPIAQTQDEPGQQLRRLPIQWLAVRGWRVMLDQRPNPAGD